MRIDLLTLFPEMCLPVLGASILKRAAQADLVQYHVTDIRDYTLDKHGKVDDRPYGGGPGMVMACQPVWDAYQDIKNQDVSTSSPSTPPTTILMTPQGEPYSQPLAEELATHKRLIIIAGHYEGIDERVIERIKPMEISMGDYVLSGGELPALSLIDSVVRLLPGALGHEESAFHDSFSPGADRMLDHPHYTRPPEWDSRTVPDVLLSGDHQKIERWRRELAHKRTKKRRPDLWKSAKDTQK